MVRYFAIYLLAILAGRSVGELFTSTEEFRHVVDTQKLIAKELKTYVSAEEARLEKIKKLVSEYERGYFQSEDEVVKYVSNPLNAYHIAKRFQQDDFLVLMSSAENARASLQRMEPYRKRLPTGKDYEGTIHGLLRLQDTYNLQPATLADGLLPNTLNTSRLSAVDCFEIGKVAYNKADYYHTVMWMQEAYDRLRKEPGTVGLDKPAILGYLTFTVYMQGNIGHALRLTNELLELEPNHPRASRNKLLMEYEMLIQEHARNKAPKNSTSNFKSTQAEQIKNERNLQGFKKSEDFQNYERLCRGEDVVPIKNPHELNCDYARNNDPRLLIAPLRRETIHLDPWLMIYYDVISDKEIEHIKELAFPKLEGIILTDWVKGEAEAEQYRVTKTTWLQNTTDRVVVPRLLRRLSAMTQLTLENAEGLQIGNYGIGGQYEPHYDFARPEETKAFPADKGNRIGTALFYLSDVPAGGFTVFTTLGLKVKPLKGSALVWYNLFKSGEGDMTLRHASCPVLVGNKWVMTKWFHQRANEFWHPCGKNSTERFTPFDIERATPTYHRAQGRFSFIGI